MSNDRRLTVEANEKPVIVMRTCESLFTFVMCKHSTANYYEQIAYLKYRNTENPKNRKIKQQRSAAATSAPPRRHPFKIC